MYSPIVLTCTYSYVNMTGVSGKFHQRYVHGETLDCSKWYNDWKSCQKYTTTKDPKYLVGKGLC